MKNLCLSIDIGGTKIRVIEYDKIFSIKKIFNIKTSKFIKENKKLDFDNLLSYLSSVFKNKYYTIGLGINGLVKNNIITYWSLAGGKVNINLESKLCRYFYFKKIIADNDVVCASKAEIKFGFGKKYNNFTFVNLGTGIRIVNVENKVILRGYQNLAGEISILPVYKLNSKKFLPLEEIVGGRHLEKNHLLKKENLKNYLSELNYLFQLITLFYNPEIIIIDGGITKTLKNNLKEINHNYMATLPNFFLAKKIVMSKIKYPVSLGAIIDS